MNTTSRDRPARTLRFVDFIGRDTVIQAFDDRIIARLPLRRQQVNLFLFPTDFNTTAALCIDLCYISSIRSYLRLFETRARIGKRVRASA